MLHYGHAGAPNSKQIQDGDMWWGLPLFCFSYVCFVFPAHSNHYQLWKHELLGLSDSLLFVLSSKKIIINFGVMSFVTKLLLKMIRMLQRICFTTSWIQLYNFIAACLTWGESITVMPRTSPALFQPTVSSLLSSDKCTKLCTMPAAQYWQHAEQVCTIHTLPVIELSLYCPVWLSNTFTETVCKMP